LSLGLHLSYTVYMRTTTLTIRTDEGLREALQKRAEVQGKTVSELAREILTEAVSDPWRQQLRERNWRR